MYWQVEYMHCNQSHIKIEIMTNLLITLSESLRKKLSNYGVSSVVVEYNEVYVVSDYDLDHSYIVAIENELSEQGITIQ